MTEEREFKGIWIPARIWLMEELSFLDKVLLAEIDSLDGDDGCWATNEYFSNFLKASPRSISRSRTNLVKYELIYQAGYMPNGCPIFRSELSHPRQLELDLEEKKPPDPGNRDSQSGDPGVANLATPAGGDSQIGERGVANLAGGGSQIGYHINPMNNPMNNIEEKKLPLEAVSKNNVYRFVKETFEELNEAPFGNYAKEGKAINQLIKKAKTVYREDPRSFLDLIIRAYLHKKKTAKQDFWREAPLTPSGLNCRFDQTFEYMRKKFMDLNEGKKHREILERLEI